MEKRLTFETKARFRKWLSKNHDTHEAVWLVFGKTEKLKTLHPDEALKEALCFGWIDGIIKRVDEDSYIKRFSHRRKRSVWSDRNKSFVNELIDSGEMTPFGLEEINRARKNGTWNTPATASLTQDKLEEFINKVKGHEPAYTNLMNMSDSIKRTYTMHWSSAKKEETRDRRLAKIIERLTDNLKPM